LADPNVDGVICSALALGDAEQKHLGAEEVIQQLSAQFDKPVVVWVYGSQPEATANRLERHGKALAVPSLERGVRMLAAMMRYSNWKRLRQKVRVDLSGNWDDSVLLGGKQR